MEYQANVDMLEEIIYHIGSVQSYIEKPMDKVTLDRAVNMIENVKWSQVEMVEKQEDAQ